MTSEWYSPDILPKDLESTPASEYVDNDSTPCSQWVVVVMEGQIGAHFGYYNYESKMWIVPGKYSGKVVCWSKLIFPEKFLHESLKTFWEDCYGK